MNILIISSEAVPYIKTGGLGDVAGTLAIKLSDRGHSVRLVLPLFRDIDKKRYNLKIILPSLDVTMGDVVMKCRVWESIHSECLQVYFIEYNEYFDRSPIYDDGKHEYRDNGARFAFFSKAALELSLYLKFKPHIAHCNDWQTALVGYYLKAWRWPKNFFKNTATVLSIHNMGYQGETELSLSKFIGLSWMQVREEEFESMGGLNFLKGGIYYADHITTVSPTYANEIVSEPGAGGLSTFLVRRKGDITGILNGIDTLEWNPESDSLLPANYSLTNLKGKAKCKSELQKRFFLHLDPEVPIFGLVGRLAYQKGLDLLKECLHEVLSWDLQMIILGSGDSKLSDFFGDLPKWYPGKVGAYIGFRSELAHMIEAGSDFFIMPSRYEPCGLNQMYSMRYGTVPIVRTTGGLTDTVEKFDPINQSGTGFSFNDPTPLALKNTIGWALSTWYNDKKGYDMLQKNGMKIDFSWEPAVKDYEKVYLKAKNRRKEWL